MVAKRWPAVGLLIILSVALSAGDRRTTAASLSNDAGKSSTKFKQGKWPFLPPVRPAVPDVNDKAWVRNPIDAFILGRLEKKGLAPSHETDKRALLRRVTFDLTGLPPTPREQADFLADQSPRPTNTVVERLLASPRYGEHWAQHWLDVVRYAESDGFKEDAHRPNAYKYRDYVIRAFNSDMPYDRFVRQQLAGDELEPDNPDAIVATGYCRLYPDEFNAADVRQRRQEILDDVTDTTGLAFLGLTIGCAQCHNHKFDDILQTDYYRLQAFFTPMLPRDDLAEATRSQRDKFAKKQAAWEKATADIRAEMESLLAPPRQKAVDGGAGKIQRRSASRRFTHRNRSARPCKSKSSIQAMKYINPRLQGIVGELKGEKKQRYEDLQAEIGEVRFDQAAAVAGRLRSDRCRRQAAADVSSRRRQFEASGRASRAGLSRISRRIDGRDRAAVVRRRKPPAAARRWPIG